MPNLNAAMATFATSQPHVLKRNLFQLFWPTSLLRHELKTINSPHPCSKRHPGSSKDSWPGSCSQNGGLGDPCESYLVNLVDTDRSLDAFPKNSLCFSRMVTNTIQKRSHHLTPFNRNHGTSLNRCCAPKQKHTHPKAYLPF